MFICEFLAGIRGIMFHPPTYDTSQTSRRINDIQGIEILQNAHSIFKDLILMKEDKDEVVLPVNNFRNEFVNTNQQDSLKGDQIPSWVGYNYNSFVPNTFYSLGSNTNHEESTYNNNYNNFLSSTMEGPFEVGNTETQSYFKTTPNFGAFQSVDNNDPGEKREVHYHQHQHVHIHNHMQEHLHDHKEKHSNSHSHRHHHKSEHKHEHSQQHQHKHYPKHQHHEYEHYYSEHRHNYRQQHRHGHKSANQHRHNAQHSHDHYSKNLNDHHSQHLHYDQHQHAHDHHHSFGNKDSNSRDSYKNSKQSFIVVLRH